MPISKIEVFALACDDCGANGGEAWTGGDYEAWFHDPSEWDNVIRDMDWSQGDDGKYRCEDCTAKVAVNA